MSVGATWEKWAVVEEVLVVVFVASFAWTRGRVERPVFALPWETPLHAVLHPAVFSWEPCRSLLHVGPAALASVVRFFPGNALNCSLLME